VLDQNSYSLYFMQAYMILLATYKQDLLELGTKKGTLAGSLDPMQLGTKKGTLAGAPGVSDTLTIGTKKGTLAGSLTPS
jgi:hypothetical protein